jgi:PIN domain nuclease of toxin-antitoxin system
MLWWSLGDEQCPLAVRKLIADERNQCGVSLASLWEVSIKSALGRGLPWGVTANGYADMIDDSGFRLQDIRRAHAIAVEGLEPFHGDPFDRLMVAQAQVEGLTLLTHDKKLSAYGNFVKVL